MSVSFGISYIQLSNSFVIYTICFLRFLQNFKLFLSFFGTQTVFLHQWCRVKYIKMFIVMVLLYNMFSCLLLRLINIGNGYIVYVQLFTYHICFCTNITHCINLSDVSGHILRCITYEIKQIWRLFQCFVKPSLVFCQRFGQLFYTQRS